MSLIEDIKAIVGEIGILLDGDVTGRRIGRRPCAAKAIVRPSSTEELSKVMKICNAANQSVVPHGGLTGVVGATQCGENDIAISLERMREIEYLDSDAGVARVQAGVVIQNIQDAAKNAGWLFGVDWGARGSANVGGMISTNAGGNSVVRYGMARENILGLEAVLADGTIVSSMNEMLKNNAGYDLKQLFIGSEGTLGIVTRAVLRLRPLPSVVSTALVAVHSFSHIVELLRHFGRVFEGRLSAFEVMWNNHYAYLTAVTGKHQAMLPTDYPYYIIVEVEGADEVSETERFMGALAKLMEEEKVADAVICQSSQQAAQIWELRDDLETLGKTMSPIMGFDVSLPLRSMEAYVDGVLQEASETLPDTRILSFGHLGDGNIHFVAGPVIDRHGLEKIVYRRLQEIGGSISAEHGIGLEKKDYLPYSRSEAEISLMRTVKNALDPKNLLNPGKIFRAQLKTR